MVENNIIVKVTADSDLSSAQLQLRELTDEGKRLEQQMKDLAVQEQKDIAQLTKMGRASDSTRAGYERERKAVQDLINANQKNVASLKNQIKQYTAMGGAGQRMAMQLRAMREELMRMEEAGDNSSEQFVNLAIAAAQLQDQMGDTQQRIRILASDTKNLDAALGVGSGLTGAFNTATSAMELFGGDMEGLQQAFYKVQAAMSILNGVQSVANFLNKDSTAMVVLNTAMEKMRAKQKLKTAAAETTETASTVANTAATTAETVATGANTVATGLMTKAQIALNVAMKANPIGAIIAIIMAAIAAVAALGVGVYKLVTYFSAAGKAQREYAAACEELEALNAKNAASEAAREYQREQTVKNTENAKNEELRNAKARNASKVELAQIELKYAKRNAEETATYANDEIKRNNQVVAVSKKKRDAKAKEVAEYRVGSKKYKKALEELTEAENEYYAAVKKGKDISQERTDAMSAQAEAQLAVQEAQREAAEAAKEKAKQALEERKEMQKQYEQTMVDIMKDGQAKELASIKLSYKNQLAAIKGNSAEAINLRKALRAKEAKEIEAVNKKYAEEEAAKRRQDEMSLMQMEVDVYKDIADNLTGAESTEYRLQAQQDYYDARLRQIQENAEIETKQAKDDVVKIMEIEAKANKEIEELKKDHSARVIAIRDDELRELQRIATIAADDVDKEFGLARIGAIKNRLDAELDLYDAQFNALDEKWELHQISYQEYQDKLLEITRNRNTAEINAEKEKLQVISDSFSQAMSYAQQISDLTFEALNSQIQAQLDAIDEEYTTDAEEAANNSKKKLITEEEYEKKKAALEMKQAKYAKAQALTNIGISTAMAIMQTLAQLGATPWGIAMSVVAGAMGAAQLAIAASKPLSQYAKGRKGGEGEYAIVGEKGPELMYVPQGASIVPNSKMYDQGAWADYGVPRLYIPDMPSTNGMNISTTEQNIIPLIDYDRLGEAMASNMPKNAPVSINVDQSGVTISQGNYSRKYVNKKYAGSWN